MNSHGNRWKKIVYRYDLISGKVNSVAFQPNKQDAFYHRYSYDSENRLILTETSSDNTVWEKDARYSYYRHGPGARTVIGQLQVQGIDYAYNLKGWLKGVNSSSLQPDNDMGNDGKTSNATTKYIARDAYSYSLNYFAGDYKSINAGVLPFPGSSAYLNTDYRPLFNGNISSMVVNIGKFNEPRLYNYRYDQLNRLTGMDSYKGDSLAGSNTWNGLSLTAGYKERIRYDANGNILTYLRKGTDANPNMDSLTYSYNYTSGKLQNNRLRRVRDAVNENNYTEDIDDQTTTENYTYDEIGNLITDVSENITNIEWTVYGKIKSITRDATESKPVSHIDYTYDASGNRISKTVYKGDASVVTWYVRDGSGNVMSTYSYDSDVEIGQKLLQDEVYLYGSSRVGSLKVSRNMDETSQFWDTSYSFTNSFLGNTAYKKPFFRGNKQYELSNHLGNVLVTVSDKKIAHITSGAVDYYNADVITANDYYPFGMIMPGRKYSSQTAYRYGFNGKENDNDVKGEGSQQDYGMRIYDPRLGRFLSVDPASNEYAYYSPYQFAGNSVIAAVDIDGREPGPPAGGWAGSTGSCPSCYVYKQQSFVRTATWDRIKGNPASGQIRGQQYIVTDANNVQYFVIRKITETGILTPNYSVKTEYYYFTKPPSNDKKTYEGGEWVLYEDAHQQDSKATAGVVKIIGTWMFGTVAVGAAAAAGISGYCIIVSGGSSEVIAVEETIAAAEATGGGTGAAVTTGVVSTGGGAAYYYNQRAQAQAMVGETGIAEEIIAATEGESTGSLNSKVVSQEIGTTTANSRASTLKPGPFAGESIPARSAQRNFTVAERNAINKIGNETGCHTCGTTNPGTKKGNFVLDHQPVSALNKTNQPQSLYPQCIGCSRSQGGHASAAVKAGGGN